MRRKKSISLILVNFRREEDEEWPNEERKAVVKREKTVIDSQYRPIIGADT